MNVNRKYATFVKELHKAVLKRDIEDTRKKFIEQYEEGIELMPLRRKLKAVRAGLTWSNREFKIISIDSFHKTGNLQGLFDANVTLMITSLFKRYGGFADDEHAKYSLLPNDEAVIAWYQSSFFQISVAEKYWQETLEYLIANKLLEFDFYSDAFISMFDCMKLSSLHGKLLAPEQSLYSSFFDEAPPRDAIAKLSRLYIQRAIGPKNPNEGIEDYTEPAEFMTMQVYPTEILAYHRLVEKLTKQNLSCKGTIIEPFMNGTWERKVKDETCLYFINKFSDFVGRDLLAEVLVD